MLLVAAGVLLSSVGALIGRYRQGQERAAWIEFKTLHQCKAIAHVEGKISKSVTPSTKGPDTINITQSPALTRWLCDDGVTYLKADEND
jgi:hypothetical protein